jgi:LmbE family N-acetylglucosaminyl deacetylase
MTMRRQSMSRKKIKTGDSKIQELNPKYFNKRIAMFVGAHPDDVDIYAGGLLYNLASSGWKIKSVVLTSGEKGTVDLKMKSSTLAKIRKKEQKDSLRLLGCNDIIFGNFHDDDLFMDQVKAIKWLTSEIRKTKPEILVSFDPWQTHDHFDHIICGYITLKSRKRAKLPLFYRDQINNGLTTAAVPTVRLFSTRFPNYHEDISHSLERKIDAVLTHKSQYQDFREEIREKIIKDAVYDGKISGFKYSESYHVISFKGPQTLQRDMNLDDKFYRNFF